MFSSAAAAGLRQWEDAAFATRCHLGHGNLHLRACTLPATLGGESWAAEWVSLAGPHFQDSSVVVSCSLFLFLFLLN